MGKRLKAEEEILRSFRTIAVVGITSDEKRPSYSVARYLQEHGYRIIPVNPNESEVLGERCYPDLKSAPAPVEVVDIFRRSDQAPAIVDDAIAIGAKAVWMQEGIVNQEAAEKAEEAGLLVVMDRCMAKEHRRLFTGQPQ